MREIIFDTETTGTDPAKGDRIIEIGAIEMVDRFPTGRTFHELIRPDDVEVSQGAFEVHGISTESLKDKPRFADILPAFKEFFAEGNLVAHNASFDVSFFNMELALVGEPPVDNTRVIDTLAIARRKFPGQRNSLDALCGRFGISNAHRTLHGALLDSELLADVYLELTGGRQAGLGLELDNDGGPSTVKSRETLPPQRQRPAPLPYRITAEERAAHAAMLEKLGENALWHRYASVLED